MDEHKGEINQLKYLKYLLQCGVLAHHLDYMDQNHQRPKKELLVEHYQLNHRDQKPKYQDQKHLLRGKHQNQNIKDLIKIGESQKFLEDLMLFCLYVGHGIILNPSKPSAILMLRTVNSGICNGVAAVVVVHNFSIKLGKTRTC